MSDTTDALESLVKSHGWRLLCDLVRKEWSERERAGRKTALNDTDDKRALDKLRQITAAQEAVEWVLELPSQEVSRLMRQEAADSTSTVEERSRSVSHLANMAGMSRRGSL